MTQNHKCEPMSRLNISENILFMSKKMNHNNEQAYTTTEINPLGYSYIFVISTVSLSEQ